RDGETRQSHAVRGRVVVNAAGPWIEHIVDKDPLNPRAGKKLLAHSRGIHLVFSAERIPLRHALALQTPDGRLVFCVPRQSVTFVGTTDVFYEGDLEHPPVPREEVNYLLSILHATFPNLSIEAGDIHGMWSGVRPLVFQPGKRTQDLSRKDEIWRSPSGLVTVAGGKLTGFRTMAQATLDAVFEELAAQHRYPHSLQFMRERGRRLSPVTPLVGALPVPPRDRESWIEEQVDKLTSLYPVREDQAKILIDRYGAEAEAVLRQAEPSRLHGVAEGVPLLTAEIPYLVQKEMVLHLSDLIIRRTGLGWFGREATRPHLRTIAREMAGVLGWDEARMEREVNECEQEAYWKVET
ncbi:MAG: FAD-dependent oxidoreductase, partial [Alicyclobacillaceae bacterium]|nr:FAD-dependent oxidoreductase [Alicyclobacillaceae bacterium]